MTQKIYFHGTRAELRQRILLMRDMIVGRQPDTLQLGLGIALVLGFTALSDIKAAYVQKADGGTDEMGISWPDLKPETKAYGRRFGPGEEKRLKAAAGLGRQHQFAPGDKKGLLTAEQLKRWRAIFAQMLHKFMLSLPEQAAKGRAAQVAWARIKQEGGQTRLQVYGQRKVQILRDTGVLLNSLSPGILSGAPLPTSYSPPSLEGADKQVFQATAGHVIVGTNVPYAGAHQKGIKVPKRQIFPEPDQVPEQWWQRWLDAVTRGLELAAAGVFQQRGV